MNQLNRLFLVATIFSGIANADWIEIGRHADHSYIAYLDPTSKKATPHGFQVWKMRDYAIPQKEEGVTYQYVSDKTLSEYDCEHRRVRELSLEDYEGHKGSGSLLNRAVGQESWQHVTPGSIGEASYDFVCKG
jgi:hypothetical protein